MRQDYEVGGGLQPLDGQQVVFHYTAYNESGATIDSTYRKDRPAETRLGIGGMIPGFEEGIKGMKAGGKRRIVVPPELGPPVLPPPATRSRAHTAHAQVASMGLAVSVVEPEGACGDSSAGGA